LNLKRNFSQTAKKFKEVLRIFIEKYQKFLKFSETSEKSKKFQNFLNFQSSLLRKV
jgi:hypothetical protein